MKHLKPKDKAKELVDSFIELGLYIDTAKQCAIIAVDEILNLDYDVLEYYGNLSSIDYWQEVKQEIEKH
jgi:hypothetical protein